MKISKNIHSCLTVEDQKKLYLLIPEDTDTVSYH